MKLPHRCLTFVAFALPAFAAEEAIDSRFKRAQPDLLVGDWQGAPGHVAQVFVGDDGRFQANMFAKFDEPEAKPLAILRGNATALSGDGWTGAISGGHFRASAGARGFDLQPITRSPPTLGAKPPAGAVVLFDGRNIDAFANKKGREWLVEDGPAPWRIVAPLDGLPPSPGLRRAGAAGAVLEVVPGTGGGIISRRKFGDCKVHLEFRTLGAPTNSGIYLQTRYEVNINETYGKLDGTPNGGLDNCSEVKPRIRSSRPPLAWQTLDIEFTAPRFDAAGRKTASARATVDLNGAKLYERQELNPPKGAAGRLGEAPTGPMMLQEHGMPVQFRNIWVVEE